jgi:hypothetical protein
VEYSPSPGLLLFQNGRVFAEDRENGTPLTHNSTRETYLGAGLRASGASGVWQANVYSHIDDFDSTFSAVAPDRASETLSLAQAVDCRRRRNRWTRRLGRSNELGLGAICAGEGTDNEEVFIPGVLYDRVIPASALRGGLPERRHHAEPRCDSAQGPTISNYAAPRPGPHGDGANLMPYADIPDAGHAARGRARAPEQQPRVAGAYGGLRAPANEYRPFRVTCSPRPIRAGAGPCGAASWLQSFRGGEPHVARHGLWTSSRSGANVTLR